MLLLIKLIKFIKFIPKYLFCFLIAKPIVYILLGLNIVGREHLPNKGPAIIVANHNSHLDGMVIMSLFPVRLWPKIRPIGAVDYFFKTRIRRWFSKYIIDVIPIVRDGSISKEKLLDSCKQALREDNIVIIFPEGTRGEPECLGSLRKGFCHLSNAMPHVPIIPIFLHGLGKTLPKGEALLVPFFVDVIVNSRINNDSSDLLLSNINQLFNNNRNQFLGRDY